MELRSPAMTAVSASPLSGSSFNLLASKMADAYHQFDLIRTFHLVVLLLMLVLLNL